MGPEPPATVIKLDHRGQEQWRYHGEVLDRTPSSIRIEALFNLPDKLLPGLSLRTGDRFVENHYGDRWYNILTVYDGTSGDLKGWYCNITRPAQIEGNRISAEDLALDLIVKPDGTTVVLDEEEFEAQELSAADRESALAALAELKHLAQALEGPFR